MDFKQNPFAILGAATGDSRQVLLALAEDTGPNGQSALAALLEPDSRLFAEISWFPGLTREKISQITAMLRGEESGEVYHRFFNEIAGFNFLLVLLARHNSGPLLPEQELVTLLEEVDEKYSALSPAGVRDMINVERKTAGFPLVSDEAQLEAALAYLQKSAVSLAQKALAISGGTVAERLRRRVKQPGAILAGLGIVRQEDVVAAPKPQKFPQAVLGANEIIKEKKGTDKNTGLILATSVVGCCWFYIVLFCLFSVFTVYDSYSTVTPYGDEIPLVIPDDTSGDEGLSSLPASGYYWDYSGREPLAPFGVTAPEGEQYYFVLLVDTYTQDDVCAFFLWPGDTQEVLVPLGDFEVYYMMGSDWQGEANLFGDALDFTGIGDIYRFYDDGFYYVGNDLDLSSVQQTF